jgi:GH35 family endo-1,4-beta-xylanase
MSVDVDPTKSLDQRFQRQAEIDGCVFEICLENPGMKGTKLWGIMDNLDCRSRQQFRPYLVDAKGRAKPTVLIRGWQCSKESYAQQHRRKS